jgi:molybdopterin-guanine dinucleotide biosynthesis protein A
MTAIVLAGGRSSRMGTPKALLPFDGEPLVVHVVRKLQTRFPEVVVVAAPGQQLPPLNARIVHDEDAYQGPVGGIYYGLRVISGDFAFVSACDAPFASGSLIDELVRLRAQHDIVVPQWQGRLQPLFAVYRTTVVPIAGEQLAAGELRPASLFERLNTRIVREEDVRRFDAAGDSFLNVNTPADYAAALERWQTGP